MPAALDPGDRKLIAVAVAILALTAVVGLLFPPATGERGPEFPSSYSTAARGAKAAYLLLEDLGFRVERWSDPPRELPARAEGVLLVLAEPMVPSSGDDKAALRRFVMTGGQVVATGWWAALLLPEARLGETSAGFAVEKVLPALQPGPLTRGAPEIELRPIAHWDAHDSRATAYYADSTGAAVVSYRLGKGRVIWWSDSEPLTNYGLKRASNLALFLNSLGPPASTHVLWDEYFHGERPSLAAYLAQTPAPWLLLQCLVLFAAVLISYTRRWGPMRGLERAGTRLSPLEFVETVGDLYAQKRAAREALEIAYHRFRFLLRRLGVPVTSTPEQAARSLRERLGRLAPEFLKSCQRAERAIKTGDLQEHEALQLLQDFHSYATRWRLAGRFRGD